MRRRFSKFVDALLRDRRPKRYRPGSEDVGAVRSAIQLRAMTAESPAPSPEFVATLHDELARQMERDQMGQTRPAQPSTVSRRRWLVQAGVAAGAAGLGIAIDRTAFAPNGSSTANQNGQRLLSPDSGKWQTVANRASLVEGKVERFSAAGGVGFVSDQGGSLRAVSGVCTHQGCLLRVDGTGGRLDCPCHRTAFSLSGDVLFAELPVAPPPLPRWWVRDEAGQVQVYLPRPT